MVSSRRLAAAAVSVVSIGLVLGYAVTRQANDIFADCRQASVAGGVGALGGSFTLVDENGRTVTDKEVYKKPSLVYFGYSFCPDICPVDAARNAEATDALEEMGYEITPVFISIDPDRDTPEVLKEYTDLMHPRMLGLTGTAAQTKAVADAYRVYFKIHNDGTAYYTVDHTTQSYLVLPGYGVVEFFNRDVNPEDLAARAACFLDKAHQTGES